MRLQRRVRRSKRHRLSSPSSSVLSNPGSISPTTATTVSEEVNTGENTAMAPAGAAIEVVEPSTRGPDPQARAQRPGQLPVGRPCRVAGLARLVQSDDPVGRPDDDGVRTCFVEHVRRAGTGLGRHVANDAGVRLDRERPPGSGAIEHDERSTPCDGRQTGAARSGRVRAERRNALGCACGRARRLTERRARDDADDARGQRDGERDRSLTHPASVQ